MVYNSYLFNIFQFIVIHTVKGFSLVNEAEVEFFCIPLFFYDPMDVGNLISGSSVFSKSQGIFPTQGSNPHFLHWQMDS